MVKKQAESYYTIGCIKSTNDIDMGARLSSNKGNNLATTKPKSPPPSVNDRDRAMLDLKRARDKLRRFRVKLETDSGALEERAKCFIREKKTDKAMFVLKLKKFKMKPC